MREAGFTLLEVLVAAVIAALAVAVLVQGAANGVQSARVAGHVEEAASRARSRMAVLQYGPPPAAAASTGDDGGGFRFRQSVALAAQAPGIALYDLVVTLSWTMDGGERQVTLRSRRTAPALAEAP